MIAKSKAPKNVLRVVNPEREEQLLKAKIILPTLEGMQIEDLDRISSFKASSNYTNVCFNDGTKIFLSKTLKSFERRLVANPYFIRVHNSAIVNVQYIHKFDGAFLFLKDGTVVKVSTSYKKQLLARFDELFC